MTQSILYLSHYYFMGQQPACSYSTEVMQLLFGLQTSDTVQVNTKGFSMAIEMQLQKYLLHRWALLSEAASPLCLTTNVQKTAILTHFLKIRFHSTFTPSL